MFYFSRANLPNDAWRPARVLGDAPRHEQLQGQAPEAVTWRASVAQQEPAKGYAPADQIAFELKSALESPLQPGLILQSAAMLLF